MALSDELKPCPFCGSCGMIAATLDDMWRPMCVVDGCCALDGYVTRPKAIEAWNTRHRTQHGAQSEPVACCQQMSGGMWIDGKHIGQHCPVHSPTTAEQLAEAQRYIERLRRNVKGWVEWHRRCDADDDCTYLNDNAWCDAEALASTGMGLLARAALEPKP